MHLSFNRGLSVFLFSTVCASSAFSTETRMGVLRYNGGIDDETLVFTYPGQIGKYKLALVELGTSGNKEAYGAAIADAGGFQLGAAVSRTDWLFTSGFVKRSVTAEHNTALSLLDKYEYAMQDTATAAPTPFLYAPARPIEVLAGFDMGGSTLGFRLSMADYKNKKSTDANGVATDLNYTAQQVELAAGFHTGSLDVALTLSPTATQKRSETANGTDSSTALKGSTTAVDFRWLAAENTNSPYAKAKIATRAMKASGKSGGRDFSSKFSDQVIAVEGGYAAMTDAKGPNIFAGAELMQTSSKGPSVTGTGAAAVPSYTANDEAAKVDATVISGTLSGEVDAAWGLGLLAGMHYVMFGDITSKDNTANLNQKTVISFPETSDATLWALGLYYKADALRLDASYEKKFLHNGPFFFSGNPTSPMLTKISAAYTF